MNNITKIGIIALSAAFLCACEEDKMNVKFTDQGPTMTVESYSATAFMGGKIDFTVSLKDKFPLSTLKAELLFDDSSVSTVTLRTKSEGRYEGTLDVPYYANIPDGVASLRLVSQNTGLGKTTEILEVAVSRPKFDYLTLKTADGTEYKMEPTANDYEYAVTGNFPSELNAVIETAPYQDTSFVFSWINNAIDIGEGDNIPFSNGVAGEYTVSFNTFSISGEPFVKLDINGVNADMVDKNNYAAVLSLQAGDEIRINGYAPGFNGWYIDADFLEELSDGVYKFLAVDGMYKINIGVGNQSVTVERMKSKTELATINLDGTGAVWMIGGSCYGKPDIFKSSWDPESDGLCLAEVSPKLHQITFEAGRQLSTSSIDVKFFGQKTWGIEFGGGTISTDSELITVGEKDGNIHLADDVTLDMGGVYRFTLDLTAASYSDGKISGALLHFEKVGQHEVEVEKISLNGIEMGMVSPTVYTADVDLAKGSPLNLTGVDDLMSYYLDPDYIVLGATGASFNALAGKYRVTLDLSGKFVEFARMDASGNLATIADHAIYLMGWGVANPIMEGGQFGWDAGHNFSMAEVEDGKFQFTGIAVEEHDAETVGGRIRYDYISAKYFGQNSWGTEMGKITGQDGTVEYSDRAKELLLGVADKDIQLKDGVNLELGATYVLVIDLSTVLSDGVERIDFYKK